MAVPTTVICGALGVGKTTAIRALFAHRPRAERWAVLVNEFGRVGLDGAILEAGGVEVREIAGGCICCTSGPMLRIALVRLLREQKPDRLLIEPTGLAHPASILDLLRSPGVREAVAVRATIGIVDPRAFLVRRHEPLYADQVLAADVLVGGWADLADDDVLDRFRGQARTLWPPPQVVATVAHGALDPAWLDLEPSPRHLIRVAHPEPEVAEHGWIWPPEVTFAVEPLQETLQRLVRPGDLLPLGVERLKGIFHTGRGWLLCQATPDRIGFEPIGWRRDSRVEVIAKGPVADWAPVEAALQAALKQG